jgi:glyoxylase-like metal-dependent hydrolase (beta-lactamase superfamily II)
MIYEVGDKSGIYCIEGAGAARVYFVAAPVPTLIDAGSPGHAELILRDLAHIGVQPIHVRRVIVTHHRFDHVGSLAELKRRTGAEVCAHPRDAEYIAGRRPRRAPRRALARIVYGAMTLIGPDVTRVEVQREIGDGAQLDGFTVVHTPGHTPGHICLLRGDVLFGGDLLQATPGEFHETPHMFTTDVPTSRRSIRKVAELDFQAILTAHQPPYVFRAGEKVRELADKLGRLE